MDSIPYDVFTAAFLSKVSEYELLQLADAEREAIVDDYMKKAIAAFLPMCNYDLSSTANDASRKFEIEIDDSDIDEIVDIVSEGMLVQWMKPFVYRQENLENALSTRDFSVFSPAELLLRISGAYETVRKNFTQMMREYSFRHGDLTILHL
jgi:hypothetical protein